MATSLQHISEKMMKMDIDKVGAQSLGMSLIPAVPDKFLIKYDPPKICVVYHFKDHSEKDQYWRDIPLEVSNSSTAHGVTEILFKEHSYYFDRDLITTVQVERLVQMIIDKMALKAKGHRNKGFGGFDEHKPKHQGIGDKNKGSNKLRGNIEAARNMNQKVDEYPAVKHNKNQLDPIKGRGAKLDPINQGNKKQDVRGGFDLLDFDDNSSKPAKKQPEKKKDSDEFDFDFEDVKKDDKPKPKTDKELEKDIGNAFMDVLTGSNKPSAPKGASSGSEAKGKLEIEVPNEAAPTDKKETKDEDKADDDDYIIIDGKRFREIQIEGEEDEFLMDDDGNIYDKEGVYIGTAKDGGEEEEEEDEH